MSFSTIDIQLITPTLDDKEKALAYIQEFKDYNSQIHGVGGLDRYLDDYSGWIKKLKDDANRETVDSNLVPGSTYFAVRKTDNKIIGIINIRHELNDYLLKCGGHIGYGIRPTERKKGYATKMLYLGLLKCQELEIDKALVTCDKNNIGSAKTIQNNFGILENEIYLEEDKETIQRYWIDVNESLTRNQNKWK